MKRLLLFTLCINVLLLSHTVTQKTDNLGVLLTDAQDSQNRIISVLKNIPYGIEVIDPGIKGMKTIERLLKTRNTADQITDYCRSTIVVKDFPSIYWCLEELKKFVNVISIDDHYLLPFPEMYRDINVVFQDPVNGHIGEVQINSKSMMATKDTIGHELFDKIRIIKAKERLENRALTEEENNLIKDLTEMSKVGYNNAFKRSYDPTRIGVYGICIKDNKILMVKTLDGDKYIFNFPGGGLEKNESLSDCLTRECQEELGASIVIKDILGTSDKLYYSSYFDNCKFNIYYTITIDSDINYGLEGAQWFPIDELPLNHMLENDITFITNLLAK